MATKKKPARKTAAKKPAAKKTVTKVTKKAPAKKVAKKVTKKAAVKKAPAKKVVKKAVVKKAPAKKVVKSKTTGIKTPYTKSTMLSEISEVVGITKKEVSAVFDELTSILNRHVKKGAAGEFTLPGVAKFKVTRKPATKARKGINPFTGEETVFKAKPARNVVKIRPLKKLKDAAV